MPLTRPWRVRVALATVVLALVTGTQGFGVGLDAEESEAQSQTCAGLLARGSERARDDGRPSAIDLDGETVDLYEDADAFYARVAEVRGPDRFQVDDPLADLTTSAVALTLRCLPDRPSGPLNGDEKGADG